jgi:rhomboid protease GluP
MPSPETATASSASAVDIRFHRALGYPANSFRLVGPGTIVLDAEVVRFSGTVRPPFRFSRRGQFEFRRDDVVNVQRTGTCVRLEIRAAKVPLPFITFWTADEATAAHLAAALPTTWTEEFVEAAHFPERLARATRHIYVTPALLGANALAFVVTAIAGAGLWTPNPEVLFRWGTNVGAWTSDGQWWRLLTCTFLHFGALHLVLNMAALASAGSVVERLYGNARFLALYVLSGVAGSLASLAAHPLTSSAGASGAIFGIYGAQLAYFLGRRGIPLSILRPQRSSAAIFIGYSLLNGFGHDGIDNAAHVGGLVAGFLLGLLLARPLEPEHRRTGAVGFAATTAAAAIVLVVLANAIGDSGDVRFARALKRLDAEDDVLATWDKLRAQASTLDDQQIANELDGQIVSFYDRTYRLFAAVPVGLHSPLHDRHQRLTTYLAKRRDGFRMLSTGAREHDRAKLQQGDAVLREGDAIIREFKQLYGHS